MWISIDNMENKFNFMQTSALANIDTILGYQLDELSNFKLDKIGKGF